MADSEIRMECLKLVFDYMTAHLRRGDKLKEWETEDITDRAEELARWVTETSATPSIPTGLWKHVPEHVRAAALKAYHSECEIGMAETHS
jgi:hypothetical protein